MHPVLPLESLSGAIELIVSLFALLTTFFTYLFTARA